MNMNSSIPSITKKLEKSKLDEEKHFAAKEMQNSTPARSKNGK